MRLPYYDIFNMKNFYAGHANSLNVLTSSLAALAVVLLSTSILLFIVGFFFGRFSDRKQKQNTNRTSDSPPQNVLYEEVVARNQEQEVELKQNEAYGPLRPQRQETV